MTTGYWEHVDLVDLPEVVKKSISSAHAPYRYEVISRSENAGVNEIVTFDWQNVVYCTAFYDRGEWRISVYRAGLDEIVGLAKKNLVMRLPTKSEERRPLKLSDLMRKNGAAGNAR